MVVGCVGSDLRRLGRSPPLLEVPATTRIVKLNRPRLAEGAGRETSSGDVDETLLGNPGTYGRPMDRIDMKGVPA